MKNLWFILLLSCGAIGLVAGTAQALKVADITRLEGQRINKLQGVGLVVGLKGTGDGGSFPAAINQLVSLLKKNEDPVTAKDLANAANVAAVWVEVTVGADGARIGDRRNVYVTSVGAATSLKGGRLVFAVLQGPVPGTGPFGIASGAINIDDPSTPTVGSIEEGALIETDFVPQYITDGHFTLILEDASASWTTAHSIATSINGEENTSGEILATVLDPKRVVVTIPPFEREHPDSFISRVEGVPVLLLPTEARVQINERTGTIIMTGDVEISPVVISHKGLTISTINPSPTPTPATPVVISKSVVALDTSNQGGAKLQELLDALDALRVPAEDRIIIVKELAKTGKLHAKLITE